ncbi:unnamed protein product [Ectocarpus sp. 6 AP-2014]
MAAEDRTQQPWSYSSSVPGEHGHGQPDGSARPDVIQSKEASARWSRDRAALAVHLVLQRSREQVEEGGKTTIRADVGLSLDEAGGEESCPRDGGHGENTRRGGGRGTKPGCEEETRTQQRRVVRVQHPKGGYIPLRELEERWETPPGGRAGRRQGNTGRSWPRDGTARRGKSAGAIVGLRHLGETVGKQRCKRRVDERYGRSGFEREG